MRDRLQAELERQASSEDLTIWARRSLPEKNALTAEDARTIEQAFELKKAALDGAAASSAEPRATDAEGNDHPDLPLKAANGNGAAVLVLGRPRRKRDK